MSIRSMTMFRTRPAASFVLAALVALLDTVSAHGGEEEGHGGHVSSGHDMGMSHGGHGGQHTTQSSNMPTDSYFLWPEQQGLLWAHVGAMILAWVFVLPLAVVFCISKSKLYVPTQLLFFCLVGLGTFFSTVYNASTPDLYENNSHHKMGWSLIVILGAQLVLGVLRLGAGKKATQGYELAESDVVPLRPVSSDSDRRSERSSSSTLHEHHNHHRNNLYVGSDDEWEDQNAAKEKTSMLSTLQEKAVRKLPALKSEKTGRIVTFLHELINRALIPLGFVQICLGVVTLTGIFRGSDIFNGLAHFIKGGIFFWYGIITLGRWLGAFSEWGWAWNLKPESPSGRKSRMPSAEMVESAVIFVYGCSNVFLEHLASWGKAWSHGDLQHVSIAVLFFGGGLCGMLAESKSVRRLLSIESSNQISGQAEARSDDNEADSKSNTSYNPMPALVIFLLGILMGSHHQTTALSSTVHKQWGMFLSGFAAMRLATYVLLYISPVKSYLPSRPPTELVGSFCLMAGGIVFMSSNKDTMASMEQRGLDAMFTLTLAAGATAFVMSWIVIVMVAKNWSLRRKLKRNIASKFCSG